MGYKQIRTSDLSGKDLDDDKVVTVVIKSHPDLSEGKVFDASPDELKGLQPIENLVELELRAPSGTTGTMILSKDDFDAVVAPEKVKTFDSTRGRRTGFRPNGS